MRLRTLLPGLLIFIALQSVTAQNKILSIEDAILKANTELAPANMQGLGWIPNTETYSYIEKKNGTEYLMRGYAHETRRDTLISLTKLSDALGELKVNKLRRFPLLNWLDPNRFLLTIQNRYIVYNLGTGKAELSSEVPEEAGNRDLESHTLQVAYTLGNNLYIAKGGSLKQLTSETDKAIVNGFAAHRNEFGIDKGTFWSPNGKYLAFYRMDQRMVTDYPLVDISFRPAKDSLIKYPMAGMKSHQATVGVYDVATGKTVFLKTTGDPEQYLTNISWSPDEKSVYVAIVNRAYTHMWLNRYDAATGEFKQTLFEETHDKYVEPLNPMYFVPQHSDQFVWLSERDGFRHFYLYNTEGKLLKQLTKGPWVVTSFLSFDPSGKYLYYTSTAESPTQNHAYNVNLKSGKITRLSQGEGVHNVLVNFNGNYLLDNYSNPKLPREIDVIDENGKDVQTLLKAENPLKDYRLGETKLFTIKADDNKTDLYCRMILPVDFNASKKYPVVVYVYGGPHAQMVTDNWLGGSNLWMQYMAQKGYILFTVDNRGSKNRGRDFEQVTYRNLGVNELKDQLKGVEYLRSLPYVDTARMGVHGWSFGGFMTTSLMTKYPGTFKVAVAGGPVIDWRYYEIMYTERYMDTPQENPEGYNNANLLNYAKNLKGRLMIIHGTFDPVVVWQHSLMFVRKCIDEGVPLDYFVYPGDEHNMFGKDRVHLMKKVSLYFDDFLK